jgi:ParB-like chromosome segregation protein Spo0J
MTTKTPRWKWEEGIEVHEAAALLPMPSAEDMNLMAADIKENGQQQPILLTEDGKLLDGRGRLAARELAGLIVLTKAGKLSKTVPQEIVETDDPIGLVLSLNLARRHLTGADKRLIVQRLLKLDPSRSNRQIAKLAGVSHVTVGSERKEREATFDVVKVSTRKDTLGRNQPATKPAIVAAAVEKELNGTLHEEARNRRADRRARPTFAERREEEEARRAALTPEERAAEDREAALDEARATRQALDNAADEVLQTLQIELDPPEELTDPRGFAMKLREEAARFDVEPTPLEPMAQYWLHVLK